MKKDGFTLSEVLITLIIIGVIAALTVPTLMNNIQNQELKTAVKKNYAVLNQALTMVIFEDEASIDKCSATNACTDYYDLLKTKLKVDKDYFGLPDGVNISKYKTNSEVIAAGGTSSSDLDCYSNNKSKTVWTLADGSTLRSCDGKFRAWLFVTVDVNGLNGPNKWGYDTYELLLNKWDGKNYTFRDDWYYMYEPGGKKYMERILDK